MIDDINERLKDKTMQIVSLNQKLETLQAQLGGSQSRAKQLVEQVTQLESALEKKESEIQMLTSELSKTREALEAVGKEVQGFKAEQTQQLLKKKPDEENSKKEELASAEQRIRKLQEDLKRFSQVAVFVLNKDEESDEMLRQVLLEAGDPKYRILSMVLSRKSLRIEEIASTLFIDVPEAIQIVDSLQGAGEIEIKDGSTVIPARKYREIKVPKQQWETMEPDAVFTGLEQFIEKTDDVLSIVKALDTAAELIEQKLARGGALIFQMRRTAESWKKQAGNLGELQYTIRDWKARARAMD